MSIDKGRKWFIDNWVKQNVKKCTKGTPDIERWRDSELAKSAILKALKYMRGEERTYAYQLIEKKVGVRCD